MTATTWPTPKWPEDVPHDISGYEKPLFSILDESAASYPDLVYTVFNDATRTYAQVKDTADRIAHFLASHGIQKGDTGGNFFAEFAPLSGHFFRHLKSRRCLRHLQPAI